MLFACACVCVGVCVFVLVSSLLPPVSILRNAPVKLCSNSVSLLFSRQDTFTFSEFIQDNAPNYAFKVAVYENRCKLLLWQSTASINSSILLSVVSFFHVVHFLYLYQHFHFAVRCQQSECVV